jgi:hypothetical protein
MLTGRRKCSRLPRGMACGRHRLQKPGRAAPPAGPEEILQTMPGVDPRRMANAVRFLSMDAIERVGEGHPGTPLGAADIATALFPGT